MGSSKPKPVQAPFEQKQQQANTYAPIGISGTKEAQDFLGVPLNFGGNYSGLNTNVQVDPGVSRRTDLAEQEANQRADSAFSFGVPRFIREANRAKETRDIQSQGAAEAQQATYAQQMGQRELEFRKAQLQEEADRAKTLAELQRRQAVLPGIFQTGGSGSSSGYNTQIMPGQGGFLSSFGQGLGAGLGGAIPFI